MPTSKQAAPHCWRDIPDAPAPGTVLARFAALLNGVPLAEKPSGLSRMRASAAARTMPAIAGKMVTANPVTVKASPCWLFPLRLSRVPFALLTVPEGDYPVHYRLV